MVVHVHDGMNIDHTLPRCEHDFLAFLNLDLSVFIQVALKQVAVDDHNRESHLHKIVNLGVVGVLALAAFAALMTAWYVTSGSGRECLSQTVVNTVRHLKEGELLSFFKLSDLPGRNRIETQFRCCPLDPLSQAQQGQPSRR